MNTSQSSSGLAIGCNYTTWWWMILEWMLFNPCASLENSHVVFQGWSLTYACAVSTRLIILLCAVTTLQTFMHESCLSYWMPGLETAEDEEHMAVRFQCQQAAIVSPGLPNYEYAQEVVYPALAKESKTSTSSPLQTLLSSPSISFIPKRVPCLEESKELKICSVWEQWHTGSLVTYLSFFPGWVWAPLHSRGTWNWLKKALFDSSRIPYLNFQEDQEHQKD